MKKFNLIISLLIGIVSIITFTIPAFAATTADVTVTAQPAYIAITNTGGNWTTGNLTGDGYIEPNTTYYSNPGGDTIAPSATVVDGECKWTVADTSSVIIVLKVTMSNFSGGGDNMTNSNAGTNGATSYGAYAWYSGMTYTNKVIIKASGSDALFTGAAAGDGDIKWGAEIKTQSNPWTSGATSTATMTIAATKKP